MRWGRNKELGDMIRGEKVNRRREPGNQGRRGEIRYGKVGVNKNVVTWIVQNWQGGEEGIGEMERREGGIGEVWIRETREGNLGGVKRKGRGKP